MNVIIKLAQKLGLVAKILPALFKGIAQGQFGEPAKRLYWAVAGYKTAIGATLWLIAEALAIYSGAGVCAVCVEYLPYVKAVAEFLVVVGLADAAVRSEPPVPPKQ